MNAELKSMEEIFSVCDFISLHVPLTEETYHMIDEKLLRKMKPTSFLINCSRGGVVDEEALYNVLKEGAIAGAAMDVYEKEPYEGKLAKLDNIVLTPHIGASTKEGQIRAGLICAEQIMKVLDGEKPDYWVNKDMME